MPDLFGNEEPAWRKSPRRSPSTRPSWTRVSDKGKCGPCVQRLATDWGHGVPYVPAGHAVWCRRVNGEVLYLCEDHATPLRTKDEDENPRRAK
jgi:hypothetical protein